MASFAAFVLIVSLVGLQLDLRAPGFRQLALQLPMFHKRTGEMGGKIAFIALLFFHGRLQLMHFAYQLGRDQFRQGRDLLITVTESEATSAALFCAAVTCASAREAVSVALSTATESRFAEAFTFVGSGAE